MRATVVATAMCLSVVGLSVAADVQAAIRKSTSIPAQGLGPALQTLAKERNFQLVYRPEFVRDQQTSGAAGELTRDEALTELLSGTGLTYRYLDERTVTIVPFAGSSSEGATSVAPLGGQSSARSAGGGIPAAAKEKKSIWQRLRLAQAETSSRSEEQKVSERPSETSQKRIELEEIIVTGTNIRGVQNSASPVFRFDREAIERSGVSTTEQFIRSVPQNFGGGSSGEAAVSFAAGEGSANNFAQGTGANLRGLGNVSTLVLVNGHRLAPVGTGNFVDISMIPLGAIDSLEVMTDGASAIYGSDAVAGVVNIMLRKEYEGAQTQLQYGAVTEGSLDEYRLDQLFGTRWGSGSAMLSYEYYERTRLDTSERSFTRTVPGPTDLLPFTRKHSAVLAISQEISAGASMFLDALYSTRDTPNTLNTTRATTLGVPTYAESEIDGLAVNLGGTFDLRGDWQGNAVSSYSDSHTLNVTTRPGFPDVVFDSSSDVLSFDAKADGSVFPSPGGMAKLAVGGHYRQDSYDSSAGTTQASPGKLERDVRAGFAELLIPFVSGANRRAGFERLELTLAGRYEEYSDFGSTADSKFGALWSPTLALSLRGTYGTSFRAPLFSELDEARFFMNTARVTDPAAGGTVVIIRKDGNNAELQPEESTTWTAGLEFTPPFAAPLKVSLTYFDIDFRNRISTPIVGGATNVLVNEAVNAPLITRNPSLEEVTALFAHPNFFNNQVRAQPGDIRAIVDNRLKNIARRKESGIDLSASYAAETRYGRIGAQLSATRLFEIGNQLNALVPPVDFVDTVSFPTDLRARAGIDWSRGGAGAALFVNYTDSYRDTRPASAGTIDSWTTLDLTLGFDTQERAGGAWLRNFKTSLNIQNLLDRDPPFVAGPPFGFNFDAANAVALGRFVSLQVRKQW